MHLDASEPGKVRRALCGWLAVDTSNDVSRVTCKVCLSALQRGRAKRGETLETVLVALAPRADAPPRITPQVWAASCRGGEHRRCGVCELCAWERQAAMWHHAAPWTRFEQVLAPERPRWPSLSAALIAYAEWMVGEMHAPSALGGILERIKRGETGGEVGVPRDSAPVRSVDDVDAVRRALEAAYPDHPLGVQLLLLRTEGVAEILAGRAREPMPGYDELAARAGLTARQVQNLVVRGRDAVSAELVRRGVIPRPRIRAQREGGGSCLIRS